ncbi:MAG: hypothetical protein LBU22_03660 [Dysgonamonadaceae bacterium]|jgi:hypothetical protein|nr:hypothetical protein [Dysgonamonadaceae bacterium]
MLHLKFIIALFYSPLGLYRSVEKRLLVSTCMPLGMLPKRQGCIPMECRVRGVYGGFYRAMHPDGMRFYMI